VATGIGSFACRERETQITSKHGNVVILDQVFFKYTKNMPVIYVHSLVLQILNIFRTVSGETLPCRETNCYTVGEESKVFVLIHNVVDDKK